MNLHPIPTAVLERLHDVAGQGEWPEPEEIKQELAPVAAFSPELLPEPLRAWVEDSTVRMQCPIDFLGVGAIVSASAIVGAGCAVRPKREDTGWHVVPNLWGGIVAEPGRLKTPALQDAMYPLNRLDAEAETEFRLATHHHAFEKMLGKVKQKDVEEELKAVAKAARKGGEAKVDALRTKYVASQELKPPARKRYKTNDSTVEKLGEILADNPRGVLVFRDELVGWLATLDEEDNRADRAFYLETWNGTGSHTWDRIGRGTVHVDNACVSVLGGIQPAKLQAYLYEATQGLQNDGLLQRFQMMVYPDQQRGWHIVDQKPNDEARLRAYRVFDRLAKHEFAKLGAETEEYCKQPFFHFDDEAQELFYVWWTRLETETIPGEHSDIMKEHLSKYRSLAPSLALLFFLIERADVGPTGLSATARISAGAVKKAIAWCEYLESHARRIYGLAGDYRVQAASALADKLRKGDLEDDFSTRDVQRKGWSRLTDQEVVRAACNELEAAGWIRQREFVKTVGRPPAPKYDINPRVHGGRAAAAETKTAAPETTRPAKGKKVRGLKAVK